MRTNTGSGVELETKQKLMLGRNSKKNLAKFFTSFEEKNMEQKTVLQ